MNIVIPMAGLGSRLPIEEYGYPKPLIRIGRNGETMIECAIESLGLQGTYYFIVNREMVEKWYIADVLFKFMVDPYKLIIVDELTDGPTSSALLAKEFINNEEPLLITNCDQVMEWNTLRFKKTLNRIIKKKSIDGLVVVYNVQTEKNSYVKVESRYIPAEHCNKLIATEFAEKKIISEYSLNGIHFWREGKDFVSSAESMINKGIRVNNEFYIAPTYNEMILQNKLIGLYNIKLEEHWAVGTPEDLQKYLTHANIQTK